MVWAPINGWDVLLTLASVLVSIPVALGLQRRSDIKRGLVEASPDVLNLCYEFAAVIWGYDDQPADPTAPHDYSDPGGRRGKPDYIAQAFERYRYRIPKQLKPVTQWILRLCKAAQPYWWRLDANPADEDAATQLRALADGMRIRGQDFSTGRISPRWFKNDLTTTDETLLRNLKSRLAEPPWLDPH